MVDDSISLKKNSNKKISPEIHKQRSFRLKTNSVISIKTTLNTFEGIRRTSKRSDLNLTTKAFEVASLEP